MMYLSGRICKDKRLGLMMSYNANHTSKNMAQNISLLAIDNGCFSQPEKYCDEGYLNFLQDLNRTDCLFATAPDVLENHTKTKERSVPVLRQIRELGYKAAYVIQDGETVNSVCWDELDCIFIGGSTKYKLSMEAEQISLEANKRNKWVHMGRVNTLTRFKNAKYMGCNSADGNCIAFAPDKNEQEVLGWLDLLDNQPFMEFQL